MADRFITFATIWQKEKVLFHRFETYWAREPSPRARKTGGTMEDTKRLELVSEMVKYALVEGASVVISGRAGRLATLYRRTSTVTKVTFLSKKGVIKFEKIVNLWFNYYNTRIYQFVATFHLIFNVGD